MCSHLSLVVVTAVGDAVGEEAAPSAAGQLGVVTRPLSRPDTETLTPLGTSQIPTDSHTHTAVHRDAPTLTVCVSFLFFTTSLNKQAPPSGR